MWGKKACLLALISMFLLTTACTNFGSENEKKIDEISREMEQLQSEKSSLLQEIEKLKESQQQLESAAQKRGILQDRLTMLKHSYNALLNAVKAHPEILPYRMNENDPLVKPIFNAVPDMTKLPIPMKENQLPVLSYAHLEQETKAYIEIVYIETSNECDEENEDIRTGSYVEFHLTKENDKWVLQK